MATGDIYELIDVQMLEAQEVLNVYFYEQVTDTFVDTDNPNPAGTLLDRWVVQMLPDVLAVQPSDVVHTEIRCRNLFSTSDFKTQVMAEPGTFDVTGADLLPTFDAVNFRLASSDSAVKAGAKRIAGLFEGAQTSGVITASTYMSALDDLADQIVKGITVGIDIPTNTVFSPRIVKRVRSGVSPNYEYRLPENTGEKVVASILSAVWNALISSQVSRKVGVGV